MSAEAEGSPHTWRRRGLFAASLGAAGHLPAATAPTQRGPASAIRAGSHAAPLCTSAPRAAGPASVLLLRLDHGPSVVLVGIAGHVHRGGALRQRLVLPRVLLLVHLVVAVLLSSGRGRGEDDGVGLQREKVLVPAAGVVAEELDQLRANLRRGGGAGRWRQSVAFAWPTQPVRGPESGGSGPLVLSVSWPT